MKTWKITAALVMAAAVIAGTGLPASASEFGALGTRVTVVRDTTLYAAPGLSTPRVGTAWAGDDTTAYCRQQDSNGQLMVLGANRPGRNGVQWANTAGFLWPYDLSGVPTSLLTCTAFAPFQARIDTGLYSAPGLSTPRTGTVWAQGRLFAVCKTLDSNGRRMVLSVGESGRTGVQWANTTGYVADIDIVGSTNAVSDC
ncbi:hypothetical protein [Lentzea flaviverrucosa]|uniref:Secreted protein n=1 Tax=Lentzea flaviverrucosa TaxID=200379 RepID=A0A1H9BTL1_9PSEU|nr:hypothetical protein [Lentzea flaviverrucosa]RDI31675.1 hypothetical protein DFR72_10375 [Lentzea flaviverrucosa]SEP92310.1 hypothetical protein SAMN05216195_101582 [Lentzea flaviverrucosa]